MQKNMPRDRFPRLIQGRQAAALFKLFSAPPRLSVKVVPGNGAIEFRFTIDVPFEVRRECSDFWELLHETSKDHWTRALSETFEHSSSGGREFMQYISNFLRTVYKDAFEKWIRDSYALLHAEQEAKRHLEEFKQASSLKRGQQPDPRVAWLVAKRIRIVKPAVKKLRQWLKKNPRANARVCEKELSGALSLKILAEAIEKITQDSDRDYMMTLRARGTSNQEIVQAYLECEIPGLSFGGGKPVLDANVRLGNELLEAFEPVR